jgi:hypothetical protein
MRPIRPTSRRLTVLVALVLAVLAMTAGAVAPATAQATTRRYAVITFEKNDRNTLRSELVWQVYRVRDGKRTKLVEQRWRAGSGAHRHATNACRKNVGWLPNGWYRPTLFPDYPGHLIKGRAILLGAKSCSDGTRRTDLFIHSEQGARSVQCADAPGDQPCRWEYPRINDYRSLGCIKLAPRDMKALYDAWRRFSRLGHDGRVRVHVG